MKILVKYFILILFAGFTALMPVRGQQSDFRVTESLTYRYYLEKNWDSVIYAGKMGLKNNIDYFYLRIRMGIAFYEKGKISKAIHHLNNAYRFNSSDTTTMEYLYFSYLKYNRLLYQNFIASKMPSSARKRILGQTPLHTNGFYFSGGYFFDGKVDPAALNIKGRENIYGEIDYPLSAFVFGLNYRHYFGGIALNAAYQYFPSSRSKQFAIGPGFIQRKYDIAEHHFYLNTEVSMKNSLTIVPAFQYQYLAFTSPSAVWDSVSLIYHFPETEYVYNNVTGSLGLYKDVDVFSLGISGSYSRIYENNAVQAGLLFTWFPFGNMKFYSTSSAAYMFFPGRGGSGQGKGKGMGNENQDMNKKDTPHAVFKQTIGGKIAGKLWLEGSVAFNGLRYFNEANAFVVYNAPEQIRYLLSANAVYEISPSLELMLGYQFARKEYYGLHYINTKSYQNDQYLINSQSIFGGITWKL